jgi:metal-dependent amidase/aminoacylase/carboxypeptidase family protein
MRQQMRRRDGVYDVEVTRHRTGWQARLAGGGHRPVVGIGADPDEALCNLSDAVVLSRLHHSDER